MPVGLIEKAKQLLTVLELTEWQWTINQVMEQPEAELWAVMSLKMIGEKIRIQNRDHNNETHEKI